MIYNDIVKGQFISRPNRFIAWVLIAGKEEEVHVKNTGRCQELLIKGVTVFCQKSNNKNRKTKYSLISVIKKGALINMDSQVPNAVIEDGLLAGKIEGYPQVDLVRREQTYGQSRFDLSFYMEGKKGYMEVKGVTLEEEGVAKFPDAPTQRGRKHLLELIEAKKEGYHAALIFLVQMEAASYFTPHCERDPAFCQALEKAKQAGVDIQSYLCQVTPTSITIGNRLSYKS